jgi:Protein of unknown function (DUF2569)
MGAFSVTHTIILFIYICIICAFFYMLTRGHKIRHDDDLDYKAACMNGPYGIGGWMILPILGFVGVAILTTINLLNSGITVEILKVLILSDHSDAMKVRLPTLLSLFFGTAVIISASICLCIIFTKNKNFQRIVFVHYIILGMAAVIDLWGSYELSKSFSDLQMKSGDVADFIKLIFHCLLWSSYFALSKRVANTFRDFNSATNSVVTYYGLKHDQSHH